MELMTSWDDSSRSQKHIWVRKGLSALGTAQTFLNEPQATESPLLMHYREPRRHHGDEGDVRVTTKQKTDAKPALGR